MTVSTSTSRIAYTGNGVTTSFSVPFPFIQDDYLIVIRTVIATGAETILTLDSVGANGYSVTGAGEPTGTVVVVTAPTALERLSIIRAVDATQEADFVANDPLPSEVIEDSLDKLTMLFGDIAGAEGLSRVPKLYSGDIDGSGRYNSNGNRYANAADGVDPDDLATVQQVVAAGSGSFIQAGAGAVTRTMQDKAREAVSAEDFGVTADGVTDDTVAMANAIALAKATSRRLQLPAGTIKTTATLDISGVSVNGCAKGYRNANGTLIEGDGTHDIFEQASAGADETRMDLSNLRIKGGLWGVKVKYMLHSNWNNVHVTDCSTGGIQFGNSTDAGGLFNHFVNIEVDVTGTGIDINGNSFVNANTFDNCYFRGTDFGGRLRCNGGIGAVNNVFNCTEFLGASYGIELENTSNTVFNQAFMESDGPAVHMVGTRNIGVTLNECTWAELKNTNPTTKTAFIYHAGVGSATVTVSGGYVYLAALPETVGLSFVASESPGTFTIVMLDRPEFEISATGFTVLNGLQSARTSIIEPPTAYASTWSAPTPPSLGDGTFAAVYTRNGNSCTVTLQLVFGAATTFGTGAWTFSVPYPAAAAASGVARVFDSGTGYDLGVVGIESGSSLLSIYDPGTANLYGSAVPITWTTGDAVNISITYPC